MNKVLPSQIRQTRSMIQYKSEEVLLDDVANVCGFDDGVLVGAMIGW